MDHAEKLSRAIFQTQRLASTLELLKNSIVQINKTVSIKQK
ncbi:hypothetical protein LEP1GSC021_0602 [Leptospira noguchii str. 1993005606]|nr:hypothetical protein [Leptospira noguchii]EPE82329.1 hypothetical protein LEP1GSC021_0602 [Leptospira noguchii str. 1993005606]